MKEYVCGIIIKDSMGNPINQIKTPELFVNKLTESNTVHCIPRNSIDTIIFSSSILLITLTYVIAIIIFRKNIKN